MGAGLLLNIGRTALNAAEFGLQVCGNNIANVNTPGYCRQRVSQTSGIVVSVNGIPSGTGVEVQGVQRIYDAFLGLQALKATSDLEDYSLREQNYARLESILYPSEDSNLGTVMDDFFNAWQDLASNPAGAAERQTILSRGTEVAASLQGLSRSLEEEIQYSNKQLESYRDAVNDLTGEIAALNQEILRVQGASAQPNDLLDRRDELLSELAGYLDITTFEGARGELHVLASGGQALVGGSTAYEVHLVPDADNHNFYGIYIRGGDITGSMGGGKMQAVLESREQTARFQDQLDTLATAFARECNRVHMAGYDLEGGTGQPLFSVPDVGVQSLSTNAGGAEVSQAEILDGAGFSLDRYEIRFTAPGTYDIVDVTRSTVVASNQAYVDGGAIEFGGLRVVLSSVNGAPAAGDRFSVSATEGMAQKIGMLVDDASHLAAAQEADTLPGDNRNALALAALRDAKVLNGDTVSPGGFYESLVGDIGSIVQDASRMTQAKEALHTSIQTYRDSVSGVSIEEEEIHLLAYQHAYQAAAKYLTAVDEMLQTLLEL
ncbi:MAG: flagellar hook-associated protein FlgK [bacterium]